MDDTPGLFAVKARTKNGTLVEMTEWAMDGEDAIELARMRLYNSIGAGFNLYYGWEARKINPESRG